MSWLSFQQDEVKVLLDSTEKSWTYHAQRATYSVTVVVNTVIWHRISHKTVVAPKTFVLLTYLQYLQPRSKESSFLHLFLTNFFSVSSSLGSVIQNAWLISTCKHVNDSTSCAYMSAGSSTNWPQSLCTARCHCRLREQHLNPVSWRSHGRIPTSTYTVLAVALGNYSNEQTLSLTRKP